MRWQASFKMKLDIGKEEGRNNHSTHKADMSTKL